MANAGRVTVVALADGYRVCIQRNSHTEDDIVTHLPLSLIHTLIKSGGRDVFDRIEDPWVYAGLDEMLKRRNKLSLRGARVLDVGCRYGTSSLAVNRLGASVVVGVDIEPAALSLAQTIVRELSVRSDLRGAGIVEFVLVAPDGRLPFAPDTFDAVVCNALFEHIAPELRSGLVAALWSLVRPGGYLIVHETPNRWWPRDGHTTGLWLIPWLPRWVVQFAIIRLGKHFTKEQVLDWDFMIAEGVRGVTYREIAGNAAGHDSSLDRNADDVKGYFDWMLQRYHSSRNRITNRVFRTICRVLECIICRPMGLPNTIVCPTLYMALRKA